MRRWVPQIVYLDTTYKILPDDGTFYGEIPTLWRVYANKDTQGELTLGFERVDVVAALKSRM